MKGQRHSGTEEGDKCGDDGVRGGRGDCREPLIGGCGGGKTTIKSSATLTEHVSGTTNSRSRRYMGGGGGIGSGGSRRITSKVTVLPSPPINEASHWYCPSCSSKGGSTGCGVQSPSVSRTYCSRCSKHSRHYSRNLSKFYDLSSLSTATGNQSHLG